MISPSRRLALVPLLALAAACSQPQRTATGPSPAPASAPAPQAALPAAPPVSPMAHAARWPRRARAAAALMIEKYGPPDQHDRRAMVWFDKGGWKRTVVSRRSCAAAKERRGRDFISQAIAYLVPPARAAELRRFSPGVRALPTAGELVSCAESEAKNVLTLNLADEVVTGRRSAASARALYARTERLAKAGKSSRYSEGLLFEVDNARVMPPTGGDR